MKKFSLFQKVLIVIMSIIFVLTIIFSIFKISVVENINKETFNMVTAIRYTFFEKPVEATTNYITNTLTLEQVREENDKLKESVASLGRYQVELDELRLQNKELKSLLDFQDNYSYLDLKPASVTFRDFERWNNIIKINVGSVDGVKVNDAVVVANGLIGRVESVSEKSSVVRLLISNDKTSKVAIKIKLGEDDYVEGIIDAYNSNKNQFELSLLETSDKIKVLQPVSTSGSGGTIPSGILLGHISLVEDSASELGETILVAPSVDFRSFEKVFVVRGFIDE